MIQSLVPLLSCIDCCTAHWPLLKFDSSHPILLRPSSSALQVVARQNIQEDGFASPRKVVSQASHRRRTADEQVATVNFYKKVANGNTFAPLAEKDERDASLDPSPELDNRGATVPDLDEGTHKR